MSNFMTLNADAAKQADQTGKFLKETGKYKGKFTKAEALRASTGTVGIAFAFESDEGQTADFSIYIQKENGEKLHSYKSLNSIMACLKLRTVSNPIQGKAVKYDFIEKKDVEYQAPLLMDLMNKPIGIVLQSCEYAKERDRVPTGDYGWKLELQGAFEYSTELTASEILTGKTKPEVLERIISTLKDRPLKGKKETHTQGSSSPMTIDDMDDQIPF